MADLQVFLLLNRLPGPYSEVLQILRQLKTMLRFKLTVINNGQPIQPKPFFHQAGLICQLVSYPLRFHPAQVLAEQLQQPLKAKAFLWLEDGLVWHPGCLKSWLTQLEQWTFIYPKLLPAEGLPYSLRVYQAQAQAERRQQGQIQNEQPAYFPPCLLFSQDAVTGVKEWLQSEGQLPLLMLAGCDPTVSAWHPMPAAAPEKTEFPLTLKEALARWQLLAERGCSLKRQQALLESLQRAFPQAPEVYLTLAPLLPVAEAVVLLSQALSQGLIYPELLLLLAHALEAGSQQTAAQEVLKLVRQRFPVSSDRPSPWQRTAVAVSALPTLPLKARLSVCVYWSPGTEHSVELTAAGLVGSLKKLTELVTEVIIVHHGLSVIDQQVLLEQGYQLLVSQNSHDQAAAWNQALEAARGDWVLLLQPGESLASESVQALHSLLFNPPVGLPRFRLQLVQLTDSGQAFIETQLRLFPLHPLLRLRYPVFPELVYEGVGASPVLTLKEGLLYRLPAALPVLETSSLQAHLQAAPELGHAHFYLAEALQQADAFEQAAHHYWQAWHCFREAEDLRVQAQVEWLRCQLQSQRLQALEALPVSEALQQHPDYWYLKGQLHRLQGQVAVAIQAFESCLAFRGSEEQIVYRFQPQLLRQAAGQQLVQLYRQQMLNSELELRLRQAAARQLRQLLKQQLSGPLPAAERLVLCDLLGEAALLEARLQVGKSALALFHQDLPEALREQAYETETALIYLSGQALQLADRLPPEYGEDELRSLMLEPYRLGPFCQALWQRSELDGARLAASLLYLSAIARQDASLAMLLGQLYLQSGQPQAALAVIKALQPYFAEDAFFLHYQALLLAQQGQPTEALVLLERCLLQMPGHPEALKLYKQLQQQL